LLHTHLALDDVHDNRGIILVVNEFGWDHVLKELVGYLCTRNHCSNGEVVLGVKQNIANQEGFTGILLPDNDDHGTFARINLTTVFQHINIELA
jgi:hypothetical protein